MIKKRGIFFRRMLLLYAVSTTIIFLLFGLVRNVYEQKNYTKQIRELNERGLAQSANACTTTLRNLYDYFNMEILGSPELLEILLAKEFTRELSISFSSLNKKMTNYSDLIHSCYVINRTSDFACSTSDTFQSLERFSDKDIIERIALYDDVPYSYIFCPRKTEYTLNGKNYSERYISIIFRVYKEGFLVINLDYDVFSDMINYRNYSETSQTLLLNNQGMVMIDSNEMSFGEDVTNADYYGLLEQKKESDGCFLARQDGSSRFICYRKNELFGFRYLTITENTMINKDMLLHIILYSIAAMILNLCCVLAGTIICYRPVGKLSSLLGEMDADDEEGRDEFKMIEKMFYRMKRENRLYVKSKRENLIKALLEDRSVIGSADRAELEKMKLEMTRQAFLCINFYPEREQLWEDGNLILFSIGNIFRELTEDFARIEAAYYDGWLSCVVNIDFGAENNMSVTHRDISRTEKLENALRQLQGRMMEYFQINLSCAVGCPVTDLLDLSESVRNAQEAFFFQFTKEENAILYRYEIPADNGEGIKKYPGEEAQAILDAIKACDIVKVRNSVPAFFRQISECHYHQALRSLYELEFELTRFEIKYEIYRNNSESEILESRKTEMKLYRMQELFLERCLRIVECYREIRDNNSNKKEIVEQVKMLVDENIMSSGLTANFLAQNVYLSISYLRSIFKEVTGGTLSNYIIRKRLDKICELLEQTDMPVTEIADSMGFASKSYLFTFFKNYMGVTPNEYRKRKIKPDSEV